jgi:Tol biopolymer transport system component
MICPNCFEDQPDGSTRCRNCRIVFTQWGGEEAGAAPGKKKGKKGKAVPAKPRSRGLRWYGSWLLVLGLLFGLAWLVLEPPVRTLLRRGTVVFVSQRDGNAELYLMRPSGHDVRRLTDHPAPDHDPVLARDGRRVAFVSERDGNPEIYVLDVETAALTRLTNSPTPDRDPSWTPDGQRIAFVCADGTGGDICVVGADGQGLVNLTRHAADDHAPSWSPGATALAFVSNRDGNAEIYTMLSDGSQVKRLTQDAAPESWPAWSPDGGRIAFASGGDLYSMAAPGADLRRLTEAARTGGSYDRPRWSPDGRRLAATWETGPGRAEVVVLPAAGGEIERLAGADPHSVAWSVDSESVAFTAAPPAARRWFKSRPTSGGKQVCVKRLGRGALPARMADSARALVLSALGGPTVDDPALEVLTEVGGEQPDWAPGGSERLPRMGS